MDQKKEKNSYQMKYFKLASRKPIAYNPIFADIFDSPTAAIFLSQLLYWHGKGKNPNWVYKTIKDCKIETGLTPYQQKTAIRKCIEKGVLKVKLFGIPAKRHFRLDEPLLEILVWKYINGNQSINEINKKRFEAVKKSLFNKGIVSNRIKNLLGKKPDNSRFKTETNTDNTSKNTKKYLVLQTSSKDYF